MSQAPEVQLVNEARRRARVVARLRAVGSVIASLGGLITHVLPWVFLIFAAHAMHTRLQAVEVQIQLLTEILVELRKPREATP